jgi:hypothetical protein
VAASRSASNHHDDGNLRDGAPGVKSVFAVFHRSDTAPHPQSPGVKAQAPTLSHHVDRFRGDRLSDGQIGAGGGPAGKMKWSAKSAITKASNATPIKSYLSQRRITRLSHRVAAA